MIPELLKAGIEWVLVDNIHFDRAHVDYPWTSGSNLYPPNPAGANYPSSFRYFNFNLSTFFILHQTSATTTPPTGCSSIISEHLARFPPLSVIVPIT